MDIKYVINESEMWMRDRLTENGFTLEMTEQYFILLKRFSYQMPDYYAEDCSILLHGMMALSKAMDEAGEYARKEAVEHASVAAIFRLGVQEGRYER